MAGGSVTIDYSCLDKLIKNSSKAASEMEDFSEVIEKQFRKKLTSLDGSDSASHISSARELAEEKKKKLLESKANFNQLSRDLTGLKETAKRADSAVKIKIESIAQYYESKQSFFQKIGSAVYGFFCDAGDFISNLPFGDMIVNFAAKTWTMIKTAKEYVSDWFKYGAGKYVANIIKSVVAVIGVVTAMAGAIVGAPMWLAVTALVAGSIALLYTFGNMMVTTEENMKALQYHKEGKAGMARFYGGINSINKWTDRTDFGGKTANKIAEVLGNTHDIIGKSSKAVLTICSAVNAFYQLRAVKNPKTGEIMRYQKTVTPTGKISPHLQKNISEKLKPGGIAKFFFGGSKNYAFWSSDPSIAYEGTKNLLSLIKTTTDVTLTFYGGKDSFMDSWKKMDADPSLKNGLGVISSFMGHFLMPDYVSSTYKFLLPEVGILSEGMDVIEAFQEAFAG